MFICVHLKKRQNFKKKNRICSNKNNRDSKIEEKNNRDSKFELVLSI